MSELKITGNPNPTVGKVEYYSVNQLLANSIPTKILDGSKPNPFEFPVEWSVHVLENGRWIKKEENNKTGNKVSYKFIQKSLERKGIRILAKKGEQTARLDVKPHNAESPKIDSIEFLDKQGKKPSKPLAYGQTLKARVHCLHMERRTVYATLWEDNDKSKENYKIETRFGTVIDGIVDIDFTLRPSAAKAGLNKDKTHKYYVTTVVNNKNMPSNPVNVKELEAPVPPYKKKTPIQQPNTPTAPISTNSGVGNVYITDINGQPIKGTYKSKKLKVWIESKGLQGKEIKLTIFDEDLTTNDLIYHNNFKITKDLYGIEVHLDNLPVSKAGRLEGDIELFVDIEVLQNHTHKKSAIVNVDAKAFKQDSGAIVNTVLKIFQPDKEKDEKKEELLSKEGCGIEYRNSVSCTKYGQQYGPVYWGSLKLDSYSNWEILLSSNKITIEEKSIIIGMSENEGKLDSIQSYDSEIVTAGAMQKTINPEGYGEFPIQIAEFKTEYPQKFKILFENCGWNVKKENDKWRAYYQNTTGLDLKNKIRTGFDASKFGKKVQCVPIESLINASKDPYFQSKQIEDFIDRLHLALDEIVVKKYHLNNRSVRVSDENYSFKAKDILKSKLGKATLLDQHINRPALTKFDLGSSMNRFFENNPNVSKIPSDWGTKHSEYEVIILEDYGTTRGGTDMKKRYNKMKNNSNLK